MAMRKSKSKALFDFARAFAELKKSKSLASTKKKLEAIFQEMHHWENTDNILEKPADQIVQIGGLLMNYDAKEQLHFYQRLLSEEFDALRAKFDHYDLAYLYTYAGECFSRNALSENYLKELYQKAEIHLEAVEIDKYGVEAGLRSYGGYHQVRAMIAYRQRDFATSQLHLYEATAYCKKIISVSKDSEHAQRAQKGIYHFNNIKIAILIHQREFAKILEQKDNLDELITFVERVPSAWTRLFNLRANFGVAELSLGRYAEALQSFQSIEQLCQKYQPLPLEESDDLQLSLSYQCLILSLMAKTKELKNTHKHLRRVFEKPISQSQKYYAFLVEWALLLIALNASNHKVIDTHFVAAQKLAAECQLQDFDLEWQWFKNRLQTLSQKKWKGALDQAPFPMFGSH